MPTTAMFQMQDLIKPILKGPDSDTTPPDQSVTNSNSDDMLAHANDHIQRPSIRGAYRPVRNGTIRGSIFAMLASALGTGCLNLPIRVQQLGIVPFIIVILLTAALAYFGMYMMKRVIIKYKVASYSEMVKRAYGQKFMKYAQIVLIIYPWAVSICLQVVFAKFTVQILADLFGLPLYADRQAEIYNSFGNVIRILVAVLNLVFNYKHFFQTDLRQMLHSIGKFSVTGVVVCMAFIVITALFGFTKIVHGEAIQYSSVFTMDYSNVVVMPDKIDQSFFYILLQGTAGIFFTFLNHQFIFPLISHLKRPSNKRVENIFAKVHFYEIGIYLIIGLLGYVLLSQHIDSVPISSLVITSIPTLPMMLGKIMILVSLFFNLPLQIFTTREYLYQALDIDRNDQNLLKLNTVLIGSSFFISLIFQKVNMYFGLIGGTAGVLMAGGIPLLCMYKLCNIESKDILIMIFVTVMGVICFAGAIQSLLHPL